jgi:hypothetical protein
LTKDEKLVVGPHQFALMVTVLSHEGLNAPGLIETIIRSIDAQIDTYLIVPGPPGYTSCRRWLNDAFGAAVRREGATALKSALEEQYAETLTKLNETRPVVLTTSA